MIGKRPKNLKNRKIPSGKRSLTSRTATRPVRSKFATNEGQKPGVHSSGTATAALLEKLNQPAGASLAELAELSGWKPNSVRGFLHGPVLKKRGLALRSDKNGSDERRYFIDSNEGR